MVLNSREAVTLICVCLQINTQMTWRENQQPTHLELHSEQHDTLETLSY